MKSSELENLIAAYREREREKRNEALRARLKAPCTREELLLRLGGLASLYIKEDAGRISLTNFSAPFIMEPTR